MANAVDAGDSDDLHAFAKTPPSPVGAGSAIAAQEVDNRGSNGSIEDSEPLETLHPVSGYDVVLVGCGKAKTPNPGPAKLLYTSPGFRNRRRIAEVAGETWFILSAEHGLVQPDEWLAPYDLALSQTPQEYRRAWGEFVVARLSRLLGGLTELQGSQVLILAPASYADSVRRPLQELGAVIAEPLSGLPQGLQSKWLSEHAQGLPEVEERQSRGPSTKTGHMASEEHVVREARNHAIAQALVQYRESHMAPDSTRLGFAETAEGDALLQENAFAFLIGVVLDEGITAERAWEGPRLLRQRLGHLDPWRMQYELEELRQAFAQRPMLHRYREIMPAAVADAARRVCEEYDGDASRIWADGQSAAEVEHRLLRFKRIGPKKSAMAVELLISHFGAQFTDLEGTNVAYDIHIRRVFLRTGLVDLDDIGLITNVARKLNPDRPGYIDLPTWSIGRQWCRPTLPQCEECPLTQVCQKLIDRSPNSSYYQV